MAINELANGNFYPQNNVGGNLPILVDPLAKAIGYRESVSIFYAGFYLVSSVLFFITMFWMEGRPAPIVEETTATGVRNTTGHDNVVFTTTDETPRVVGVENSKL